LRKEDLEAEERINSYKRVRRLRYNCKGRCAGAMEQNNTKKGNTVGQTADDGCEEQRKESS
jgi:hypothetical protein